MITALVASGLELVAFAAVAAWWRVRRSDAHPTSQPEPTSDAEWERVDRVLAALQPSLAAVESRVALVRCHRDRARPDAARRPHKAAHRCASAARREARRRSSPWRMPPSSRG